MSKITISFLLPPSNMPSAEEQEAWQEGTYRERFPKWASKMPVCWIYQSWFFLQQAGVECRLITELPSHYEVEVIIACSNALSESWALLQKRKHRFFIVNVMGDREPFSFAQLHLLQNRGHVKILGDAIYMPHWPQPGILPRDLERGELLEHLAFFGGLGALEAEIMTPEFQQQLQEELRIKIVIPESSAWHDFRNIDVAFGIRSFSKNHYWHKPASKLYNAWLGEVPFIGGNDSAFRADGHPGKDYLVATTKKELLWQLKRLRDSPELRKQLVLEGKRSVLPFTHEATLKRWRHLIEEQLPRLVERWNKKSYAQKSRFWQRRIFYHQRDYQRRPDFYNPPTIIGTWGIVMSNFDQLVLLKEKTKETREASARALREGNQELSDRWEKITFLLERFSFFKGSYKSYLEPFESPSFILPSYLAEGAKLFEEYMATAQKELESGNSRVAERWIGWSRTMKEVTSYYQLFSEKILQEILKNYHISQEQITQLRLEYEHERKELLQQIDVAKKPSKNFNLEDIKLLQRLAKIYDEAIKLTREHEQFYLVAQKETNNPSQPASTEESYDAMLSLFWKQWSLKNYQMLIFATQNAYAPLIPIIVRMQQLASHASDYRWQAFLSSRSGNQLRTFCWRKAAFHASNGAKVAELQLSTLMDRKLAIGLPHLVKKVLRAASTASWYYAYWVIPFVSFCCCFCPCFQKSRFVKRWSYHLFRFLDHAPTKVNQELQAIIEEHTVSQGTVEQMNNIYES